MPRPVKRRRSARVRAAEQAPPLPTPAGPTATLPAPRRRRRRWRPRPSLEVRLPPPRLRLGHPASSAAPKRRRDAVCSSAGSAASRGTAPAPAAPRAAGWCSSHLSSFRCRPRRAAPSRRPQRTPTRRPSRPKSWRGRPTSAPARSSRPSSRWPPCLPPAMAGEALISSSQLEARGGAPLRFSWRAGSERPVGPCVTTAAIELSPTQILARDAGGQNTLRLDSALLNNTLSCVACLMA